MIICVCRKISENDLNRFAGTAPDLKTCWIEVSTEISGRSPVCNNGKGRCLDCGQDALNALHDKSPAVTLK